MSSWVTYYRTSDGTLLGHGTVPPESIPKGVSIVSHGATRMDQGNRWDPATFTWVAIPPEVLIDRLQDMAQHAYLSDVWSRLTVAQRIKLRKAMVWLLGTHRYRQPLEEVSIDPTNGWSNDPTQVTE